MEGLIKLTIAAFLGGVVGIERQISGQNAGFRTQLLVCLGSCLFTIVSVRVYEQFGVVADPGRIAAQVITGIGFLGAGAILRFREKYIRGLTTAASLWIVSAIGMGVGFGEYTLSVATTLLVIFNLSLLKDIEDFLPINRYMDLSIRISGHDELDIQEIVRPYNLKVMESRVIFHKAHEVVEQRVTIRYRKIVQMTELIKDIKKLPAILELGTS
ncbi:MAG: MgtC/SapB family protein [Thermodesulfovibrionales bacterium]